MRKEHVQSSLMDIRKEHEWLELSKWKQRSEPIEKPSRPPPTYQIGLAMQGLPRDTEGQRDLPLGRYLKHSMEENPQ